MLIIMIFGIIAYPITEMIVINIIKYLSMEIVFNLIMIIIFHLYLFILLNNAEHVCIIIFLDSENSAIKVNLDYLLLVIFLDLIYLDSICSIN